MTPAHRLALAAFALSFLPSCLSSTLATAAVAGSGLASLPAMNKLLGKDAPQPGELVGHSMDYSGERRGMDNVGAPVSGSILFGSTNPDVIRQPDGSMRSTFYSRQGEQEAVVTITTAAGVETFRLKFEDAKNGSYVYEKRHGADVATGEGAFTIQ